MQIVLEKEKKKEKKKEKETKTCGVFLDSACGCCKNENDWSRKPNAPAHVKSFKSIYGLIFP